MDAGMYGSSIGKLINEGDTALIGALRRAAKNDLYVDSRSIAVNGLTNGSVVVTIVPGWQKALLIANAGMRGRICRMPGCRDCNHVYR